MTNPAGNAQPLIARTFGVDFSGPLLQYAPIDPLAWIHNGDGMVAWGQAVGAEFEGPDSFAEAERWWAELTHNAVIRDEINVPGTGLLAFGSFAFDPRRGVSRLIVPKIVIGRRENLTWVTTIGDQVGPPPLLECQSGALMPARPHFERGTLRDNEWLDVVSSAIRRITAGEFDKVVLARDSVATFAEPLDVRWPLAQLVENYPSCWTFKVGDFFGSTPEMLVRRERGLVASRVLAGTIRRTGDDEHDLASAAALARSSKDREEHQYAVSSVVDALEPHCASMNVPESPYVLHLPNVMHLATDVTGVAQDDATALSLAAALHPSAAVGGTPTSVAVDVIAAIEGMDRGPYAGPVGWIDADGDGEWGIGLRSAMLEDGRTRARLYAGCGIVADSVPADELAESNAKLVPVTDALTSRAARS